jgi:hypothetical protein
LDIDDFWLAVEEELTTAPLPAASAEPFDAVVAAVNSLKAGRWSQPDVDRVVRGLADGPCAEITEAALAVAAPRVNPTISTLRSSVIPAIVRREIGAALRMAAESGGRKPTRGQPS